MDFFDTSVTIAASIPHHIHHARARAAISGAATEQAACAAHSIAETYAVLTRMPLPSRVPPLIAARMAQRLGTLFKVIALSAAEQLSVIADVSQRGLAGGILYDALIVACARKAHATRIYTFNTKHFRMVAPDLAPRIIEP